MFTSCIPWDPWIFYPHAFVVGDWVRQFEEYYSPVSIVFLKSFQTLWVVLNIIKRVSNTRKLEKSNPHDIQLLSTNLKLVKVLMQETCGEVPLNCHVQILYTQTWCVTLAFQFGLCGKLFMGLGRVALVSHLFFGRCAILWVFNENGLS
jgi:hypothetical protein